MRPIAVLVALALATLFASCAGHSRALPASAGFSTPDGTPEGKLSPPAPQMPPVATTHATAAPKPAPAAAAHPGTAAAAGTGAAAAASAAKPAEVTYVDVLPEPVTRVPPSYPDSARKAGISGTVTVQAYVKTDGSVGATRILESVRGLDEAAETAVKQWRFKPATLNGQPVAWWVSVPVKFSLH